MADSDAALDGSTAEVSEEGPELVEGTPGGTSLNPAE
jgi:hypothetical protein